MSDGTNDRCVISAKYDACLSFPLALFLAEIWVNNLGLWAAIFPTRVSVSQRISLSHAAAKFCTANFGSNSIRLFAASGAFKSSF